MVLDYWEVASSILDPWIVIVSHMPLNTTEQHLDNKRYKNITVMIYVIFVQYMKCKVQVIQERSEYDLMTNSMSFIIFIFAIVRRWQKCL